MSYNIGLILENITLENITVPYMDRLPYDIQTAVSLTHTFWFRQIPTPLFDLYYMLEIITLGNYNGPVYVPLTLRYPDSSDPDTHILFLSNSYSIVWPLLYAGNYNVWKL